MTAGPASWFPARDRFHPAILQSPPPTLTASPNGCFKGENIGHGAYIAWTRPVEEMMRQLTTPSLAGSHPARRDRHTQRSRSSSSMARNKSPPSGLVEARTAVPHLLIGFLRFP